MKKNSTIIILFVYFGFFIHSNLFADTRLKFTNDATLKIANEGDKTVKAGESILLASRKPIAIESVGRVPLLLVPMNATDNEIEVKSPEVRAWPPQDMQKVLDTGLNEVLRQTFAVQKLLLQKKADEALRILDSTQNTYPGATQLNFLRASTYVLLGKKQEALHALQLGLEADPQNAEGRELKKVLGGSAP